jgi:hypothetical protein
MALYPRRQNSSSIKFLPHYITKIALFIAFFLPKINSVFSVARSFKMGE